MQLFTVGIIDRKHRGQIILPKALYTTYMVAYGLTIPRDDKEELVNIPRAAVESALNALSADREVPRDLESALRTLDSYDFIVYESESDYLYVGHKDTIVGLVIQG